MNCSTCINYKKKPDPLTKEDLQKEQEEKVRIGLGFLFIASAVIGLIVIIAWVT